MIKNVKCDLLKSDVELIAHCCNCFNNMGSGVALAIKNKYPEAYAEDCKTKKGDRNKLGKFTMAYINEGQHKFVANLYGQYDYGRDSRKLNYEAIYSAFEGLRDQMIEKKIKSVGFPYLMGCDRAGGSWTIVYFMIEEIFKNTGIQVQVCKL